MNRREHESELATVLLLALSGCLVLLGMIVRAFV